MYNITQTDINDIIELLKKAIKYEDFDSVEEAIEYLDEFLVDEKEENRME